MIARRYRRLAKVWVTPNLEMESPRGGRIRITRGIEDAIRIECDSNATLWELFDLQQSLGLIDTYQLLKRLRNPFFQDFDISVDARSILRWRAGRYPGVVSLRGTIDWLKSR